MTDLATRPHALYRFFDRSGSLLYVGITANPGARWSAHADDRPWWSEVASATLEQHPDRATVLAAERDAIRSERPRYNVVHARGGPSVLPAERVADTPRVVALGLADGRCPIGCVEAWDEWVRLALFDAWTGEFGNEIASFREAEVVEVRDARPMTERERSTIFHLGSSTAEVFRMGPVVAWQARWKHRHGLIDAELLADTLKIASEM